MGLVRRRNEEQTTQRRNSPRCTGAMKNPEPAGLWGRGKEEGRQGSALRRYT